MVPNVIITSFRFTSGEGKLWQDLTKIVDLLLLKHIMRKNLTVTTSNLRNGQATVNFKSLFPKNR